MRARPPSVDALTLIGVPYHLGQRGVSMGRGPLVLLTEEMVPRRLRRLGLDVEITWVDAEDPGPDEPFVPGDQMARHLVHNRAVARRVAEARAGQRAALVSSGNCNSAIGVTSGLANPTLGVVWLDAHADAETPEHSADGLFDGMAVSVLAGRCWKAWREQIPGYRPIAPERIVMVGQHDRYDEAGWPHENLEPLGEVVDPPVIAAHGFERALDAALERLATKTDSVYLHVDTDVIDADIAKSSHYTAKGGLTPEQTARAIQMVTDRFDVAATTFAAYDPDVDPQMLKIVPALMETAATGMLGHR